MSDYVSRGLDENGRPQVTIQRNNGKAEVYKAPNPADSVEDQQKSYREYMANDTSPQALHWQSRFPVLAEESRVVPGSHRDSMGYAVGSKVHQFANRETPTIVGKTMNQGILPASLLGGGVGLTGGLLLGWLAKKALGSDTSPLKWGLIGGALGAAGGGINSAIRNSTYYDGNIPIGDPEQDPRIDPVARQGFSKQAAMFNDPRNFILEKLQGANDIDMGLKAQLAAAVRGMSMQEATRLKEIVRGAIGFGIGALIAKFVFGASGRGTLFGGLAGVLGAAAVNQMHRSFGRPMNQTPNLLQLTPSKFYY